MGKDSAPRSETRLVLSEREMVLQSMESTEADVKSRNALALDTTIVQSSPCSMMRRSVGVTMQVPIPISPNSQTPSG